MGWLRFTRVVQTIVRPERTACFLTTYRSEKSFTLFGVPILENQSSLSSFQPISRLPLGVIRYFCPRRSSSFSSTSRLHMAYTLDFCGWPVPPTNPQLRARFAIELFR